MIASRPLPGIRFETVAPAPDEALPRMDIAVFAGFASTGPLHLPVAIESTAQFAAVFGADAPLARDAVSGARLHACLGPAVRAFFSNGGLRCWIIRVARSASLEALRLQSGAAAATPSGVAETNRYPLSGLLAAVPKDGGGWSFSAATARARCEGSWADPLRVATALTTQDIDVLPLSPPAAWSFTTATALGQGELLRVDGGAGLLLFAAVQSVLALGTTPGTRRYRIALDQPACFRAPQAKEATLKGTASIGDAAPIAARLTPAGGTTALLKLVAGIAGLPASGSWIAFTEPASGGRWWFCIARLAGVTRAAASKNLLASFEGSVWQEADAPAALPATTRATALRLSLDAASGGSDGETLDGLGLAAAHPQWWNAQPDDESYYASADAVPGARFPLAGDGAATSLLLPLSVRADWGPALPALNSPASALERDGLSRIGAELFLDPAFLDSGLNTLLDLADFLRFMSPTPRRLFGIHAALGYRDNPVGEEATLIAVPDAMHRGWDASTTATRKPLHPARFARPEWLTHRGPCARIPAGTPAPKHPDWSNFLDCALLVLHTPHFFDAPVSPSPAGYTLRWTRINPHPDLFVLEEARLEDWSDAREIYRGAAPSFDVVGREPGTWFYRVRAERGGTSSEWSKGLAVTLRADDWAQRDAALYAGDGEDALLAVHRALLRLCAAQGELFAVLALPAHYREADAIRYSQRLRLEASSSTAVPAIAAGEALAYSYGALYHPWQYEPQADGSTLAAAPDGLATGVLAARSLRRGAWIAPANEVLKDVVALTPVLRSEARQALQDQQLNLLRQEARGFLILCADTLSDDEDLRPINVRRLLILLRRLALQRGARYVFEPNGALLRRQIQRGFETAMAELFRRGAFAGARPEQSYQVRVGDDLNTAQSIDAGRLIVELKVAPARPMSFLTVRLQQVGERLTVAETF